MLAHHGDVMTLSVVNRDTAPSLSSYNIPWAIHTASGTGWPVLDAECSELERDGYCARPIQTNRGKAGRTDAQ
jgi:hypothetical protein